jgi:hypothetical protein
MTLPQGGRLGRSLAPRSTKGKSTGIVPFILRISKGIGKKRGNLGGIGTGGCEKIDFESWREHSRKKIALGGLISDCWCVGKHFGSKIKSRKSQQIDFFTSSSLNCTTLIDRTQNGICGNLLWLAPLSTVRVWARGNLLDEQTTTATIPQQWRHTSFRHRQSQGRTTCRTPQR